MTAAALAAPARPTAKQLALLRVIADQTGRAEPRTFNSVYTQPAKGWPRSTDGRTNAFLKNVKKLCDAMAEARWISPGMWLPSPYNPRSRTWAYAWEITDHGREVLAAVGSAPSKPRTARLTVAQATMVERMHLAGGDRGLTDQSWQGEVDERNTMHGLVRAGLVDNLGRQQDADGFGFALFRLNDAGRHAYASNGEVRRTFQPRCANPLCCGTWPEDLPIAEQPYGSCRRCGRWVSVRKGGMGRHTMQPGIQCTGVGSPPEGAESQ